jgi:hypothetical protein
MTGVQFLAAAEILLSPSHRDQLFGQPNKLSDRYRVSLTGIRRRESEAKSPPYRDKVKKRIIGVLPPFPLSSFVT